MLGGALRPGPVSCTSSKIFLKLGMVVCLTVPATAAKRVHFYFCPSLSTGFGPRTQMWFFGERYMLCSLTKNVGTFFTAYFGVWSYGFLIDMLLLCANDF